MSELKLVLAVFVPEATEAELLREIEAETENPRVAENVKEQKSRVLIRFSSAKAMEKMTSKTESMEKDQKTSFPLWKGSNHHGCSALEDNMSRKKCKKTIIQKDANHEKVEED